MKTHTSTPNSYLRGGVLAAGLCLFAMPLIGLMVDGSVTPGVVKHAWYIVPTVVSTALGAAMIFAAIRPSQRTTQ